MIRSKKCTAFPMLVISVTALTAFHNSSSAQGELAPPSVRQATPPTSKFYPRMQCKDPTGVQCNNQEDFERRPDLPPLPPPPKPLTPEEKQAALDRAVEEARRPRGPDGYILPSERSIAEKLGCGYQPGPEDWAFLDPLTYEVRRIHTARCFYVAKMDQTEKEVMIHASWMNLERRDEYLQARGARIRRDIDRDAFPVYEPVWIMGWMPAGQAAYSHTFAEDILMGLWVSNARYCNWPKDKDGKYLPYGDEALPPEAWEAADFFCTTEIDVNGETAHNAKLEAISRAMLLFHKLEISKMGGLP